MFVGIARRTTRAAALLAGTAALAIAGCGGDDDDGGGGGGDDAQAAITAVTQKALTSQDPAVRCGEVVTQAFIRVVYGDLATCRKAETPDDDDKPATGAEVTSIQVDGDKATARVTVQGGESPGATGDLSYAREDGAWKVDELSVAFLRSQLEKGLENAGDDEDAGPLADPKVRSCVGEGLQKLDDRTFRELAYAAIADRDPTQDFVRVITECASSATSGDSGDSGGSGDSGSSGGGKVSLLRQQFEKGISQSLKRDGASDAQVSCVTRRLRDSISEDEIIAQVQRGSDDVSGDLAAKAARALAACR